MKVRFRPNAALELYEPTILLNLSVGLRELRVNVIKQQFVQIIWHELLLMDRQTKRK